MEIQYREAMTSIYELKEKQPDVSWILRHFLQEDDEVLYFVDNEELKAVVSIGDLFHHLEGRKRGILNTDFTWVGEKKSGKARAFFLEHPTVHELPVINDAGRFIGVIQSGKRNSERIWNKFRSYAKSLYYGEEAFYRKAAERFMEHFKGIVLLADLPDDGQVVKRLKDSREKENYANKSRTDALTHLRDMTEQEERKYWGDTAYEPGISKRFAEEFSKIKVTEKNGIKYYENSEASHFITFAEGKRKLPNQNGNAIKRIYLVGPCTIFGAYVTDHQTVGYYLQQRINDSGYEWQVVNNGSLGPGYEFQYLLTEGMDHADIVLIAFQSRRWTASFMENYQNAHYIGDFTDIFDNMDDPTACILDTFRHTNYRVSEEIAQRIFISAEPYLGQENNIREKNSTMNPIQNYYIPWDIYVYYKDFASGYGLEHLEGTVGAIVMNCNPFTMGHRYLVEYAAAKVDTLILFVVEEDASVFSFADRIEMVRRGTQDINNIKVVPSGKYNISKSTFAQYFEKDKEISKIDSMEYDVRIFCEVIAECMNISCRFVGEEPTDLVTRQYNETMKAILPQYGITLDEIPRLEKGGTYISASRAREWIAIRDWEGVTNILSETTIQYLKNVVDRSTIKISVIVPVYNAEKYLAQCLDSILSQTLKEIEVVCVNDGSTDSSGEILAQYALQDERVKVLRQENRGYGASMNAGLNAATGVYVGIVESDDCILPEMYKTLYEETESEELDVVKSDAYFWYEKIGYQRKIHPAYLDTYYNRTLGEVDRNIFFDFYMNIWTGIYKRAFLLDKNIRFHESAGASYQDNGFWLQTLSYCKKAKWINKAFYLYRQDNEASSVKSRDKVFAMTREYEYIEKILLERKDYQYLPYCYYYKLLRHRGNFLRIADAYKREFCEQIRRDYTKYQGYIKGFGELEKWLQKITLESDQFCHDFITVRHGIGERLERVEFLIIYGAGYHGDRVFRGLVNEGYYDAIACFAVSRDSDQGILAGKPILTIDDAVKKYPGALVIVAVIRGSGMYLQMEQKLSELGVNEYLAGSDIEENFYIL